MYRDHRTGLICGLNAYWQLKVGHGSQLQYKDNITLESLKGFSIGYMSHSCTFVASLIPIFTKLIDSHLQRYLSTNLPAIIQPPLFAIIGKKIMPNNQIFQIVGIISCLPGCLDSLAVDLPVVSEHTRLDIAHTAWSFKVSLSDSRRYQEATCRWCNGWTIFYASCADSSSDADWSQWFSLV